MKTNLILSAALALFLVGCGDSSNKSGSGSTNAAAGSSPVTAPVDYLKSAANAEHLAVKTVDVTSLKKAIDLFNVQEGRLPKDLKELADKKYIPEIPTPPAGYKLDYDANSGTVKVVKE